MTYQDQSGKPEPAKVAPPRHFEWLNAVEREIQEDYDRLHALARDDIQRSGHGGEVSWVKLLQEWLPPAYEVVTRKYLLPEVSGTPFETDIVVFRPSYPAPLRKKEEVLMGGVAAAFSVKLSLDAAGIRDAFDRAVKIRRMQAKRAGTPRDEMLAPFPIGLLAHSHTWKEANSKPLENVTANCIKLDHELCTHPRETLDLVCVADLSTWSTRRFPFVPPRIAADLPFTTPEQKVSGYSISAITANDPAESPAPVGAFIARLIDLLSNSDETLLPLSDSLRLTKTMGSGSGEQRIWDIKDVFSEGVASKLGTWGTPTTGAWASGF